MPPVSYACVLKAGDAKILYLTVAPTSLFGTVWANKIELYGGESRFLLLEPYFQKVQSL